ncbi:MAG: sulfate adenylyltransferase, partial [Anaerolineaceae bacterium]|nr:sulfate adenylyltransferase [Anaerolineaceae bacterium]
MSIPPKGVALIVIILAGLLQSIIAFSDDIFHLDQSVLKQTTYKWGKQAQVRLLSWENLMRREWSSSDREKLEKVNSFMNKIPYREDIDVWGVPDYWATPVEFLGKGAGDCEDYAIAKYFTLKAMGIPEQKLRITYVKSLQVGKTHMVLTYANKPGDEPLVLDNLYKSIKPASERRDLMPIFSFNGTELWMAQQRG